MPTKNQAEAEKAEAAEKVRTCDASTCMCVCIRMQMRVHRAAKRSAFNIFLLRARTTDQQHGVRNNKNEQ